MDDRPETQAKRERRERIAAQMLAAIMTQKHAPSAEPELLVTVAIGLADRLIYELKRREARRDG